MYVSDDFSRWSEGSGLVVVPGRSASNRWLINSMKTQKAFLVLAGVLATGASVFADKVTLSATPSSVQQVVRSKAGAHEIEDIDRESRNGQMTYEVSWKNNAGVQQELLLNENGQILRDVAGDTSTATGGPAANTQGWASSSNRTPISLSDAPRAVQAAVYTQVPNAPIDSVQRVTRNGRTFYEVSYQENGQARSYRVDENGKPVQNFRGGDSRGGDWQPQFGTAATNLGLSSPEKIDFNNAPRNVQRTVNHIANGAPIESIYSGKYNGRTVYSSTFRRNGETIRLQTFDDGSIVTRTPGVTVATTTAPATKRSSFFDKAADLLGGGGSNNAQPAATPSLNLADAPQAVQQTVNQNTRGAALQNLQRSDWNGRALYEASFQQNGQDMRLQVLDDGSILSMRPASSAVGAPGTSQTGSGRGN